jgi:hypothetical protein
MRLRTFWAGLAALGLTALPVFAAPYNIKVQEKSAPPKEAPPPVARQLAAQSVQFLDEKGKPLAEVWFRKDVPVKATDGQVKNGLTYQEVTQGALLGVVRFQETMNDYRKQRIKPGVYTLRLASQPMDGDHMGTAPYGEFALLVPVANDPVKEPLDPEKLQELSKKASGTGHPAIFLLFPVAKKDLGKAPKLEKKTGEHWVLTVTRDANVNGKQKASIGIGLTLIGTSPAA